MFLQKKYVFESRKTRFLRYLINLILSLLALFVAYSILCFIFILVSTSENKNTDEALFENPPDLIVVFTGDEGRIPYALKKSLEYDQPNIFITGVYSKNTVDILLAPLSASKQIDLDFLEIDYLAKNTIENVISTLHYLRRNSGMEQILIISNDYHIMRIKLLMNKLKAPSDEYKFYYSGIKTDYGNLRNIKTLYLEFFKLLKAYALLLLWDPENIPATFES